MPLVRESVRKRHTVIPIAHEFGRYSVNSASAAKKGLDEAYVVDVLAIEETNHGKVTGVCPCKGWQVRKTCTHLIDAREYHKTVASVRQAAEMGFERV